METKPRISTVWSDWQSTWQCKTWTIKPQPLTVGAKKSDHKAVANMVKDNQ